MKKIIEFDNTENNLESNKFYINLDNMKYQQKFDEKFDILLNGLLENKEKKSKL